MLFLFSSRYQLVVVVDYEQQHCLKTIPTSQQQIDRLQLNSSGCAEYRGVDRVIAPFRYLGTVLVVEQVALPIQTRQSESAESSLFSVFTIISRENRNADSINDYCMSQSCAIHSNTLSLLILLLYHCEMLEHYADSRTEQNNRLTTIQSLKNEEKETY